MPLERFSAAWREQYIAEVTTKGRGDACVFCELAEAPVDETSGVLARREHVFVTLNAFPYGSGHLLVVPRRHVGRLEDLSDDEYVEFARTEREAVAALAAAYAPDGMNLGLNLGSAAGAGIPEHLHAHVLPRWEGDTNFMTTIGEVRVLPESLATTWRKVHAHLAP